MNNNTNLLDQINSFKDEYYAKNTKNIIFKKNQKIECSKEICQNFNLNELIEKTIFIIPNTSHLYFDYLVFKLYANEFNYQHIITYTLKLIDYCVNRYGNYSVHIDLNTFTVSAGERYYKFVELYVNCCLLGLQSRPYLISEKLQYLYLYNPPSVMDMLHKMFKSKIEYIKEKINIVSKKESKEALDKLLYSINSNDENNVEQVHI